MIGPFEHLFLLRDLGFCKSGGEHYHLWGPVEKNIIQPGRAGWPSIKAVALE